MARDGAGGSVTALLHEWRSGNRAALDELMPLVYGELHRIAARHLRNEPSGHTLRPTDLVSEAYLRLTDGADCNDRIHFFAIAATKMRQILVDHARKRMASKRGGGVRTVQLDDNLVGAQSSDDLLVLHDALEELAAIDARKADAVELRYFGGLKHDEIATHLKVHVNTVSRDLRMAEAWIHRRLRQDR